MTTVGRGDNPHLMKLIEDLKSVSRKHNAPIWRAIADRLGGSNRNWSEVNVSRIARFAKEGETLVIPGKLLGSGSITFGVTVAAFRASAQAKKKIEAAGGRTLSIRELASTVPEGTGIRIMG